MALKKIKKGSSKELLCRKEHEADNWKCVFKSQRVRFGKIDFAGLFDCVFVRGKTKRYVSVKNQPFSNAPKTSGRNQGLQGKIWHNIGRIFLVIPDFFLMFWVRLKM